MQANVKCIQRETTTFTGGKAGPHANDNAPGKTYQVAPGDSLSKIAQKHGLSLEELVALNPQILNIDRIYIGEDINLPAGVRVAADTDTPAANTGMCAVESPYTEGLKKVRVRFSLDDYKDVLESNEPLTDRDIDELMDAAYYDGTKKGLETYLDVLAVRDGVALLKLGAKGSKVLYKGVVQSGKTLYNVYEVKGVSGAVEYVLSETSKGLTNSWHGAKELAKDSWDYLKKVFTKSDAPHHKTHAGSYIENAYIEAISGGKHKVWAQQYLNKSPQELQKGIKSFEKQIELHQNKIKDPAKYNPGWDDFRSDRKTSLMKRWPKDIERHKEQKAILETILKTRGN